MQGIQLDLVSEAKISQMASMEKVRYIIDEVRKGKILVLEKGLNPMEEAKLIEMTMSAIQPDVFSGIICKVTLQMRTLRCWESFSKRQ